MKSMMVSLVTRTPLLSLSISLGLQSACAIDLPFCGVPMVNLNNYIPHIIFQNCRTPVDISRFFIAKAMPAVHPDTRASKPAEISLQSHGCCHLIIIINIPACILLCMAGSYQIRTAYTDILLQAQRVTQQRLAAACVSSQKYSPSTEDSMHAQLRVSPRLPATCRVIHILQSALVLPISFVQVVINLLWQMGTSKCQQSVCKNSQVGRFMTRLR